MAWVMPAIGGALQTVGLIGGNLAGDKYRKELNKAIDWNPTYGKSPYTQKRWETAQNLLNAKSPWASSMERQLMAAQGNQLNFINRNATDSSQALALGASALGQTNNAIEQQRILEAQDYYNKLNNYNQASDAMTGEHRASFDDQVRRWQDWVGLKAARYGVRQQQWQGVINKGASMSSMGFGSGGKMGGK